MDFREYLSAHTVFFDGGMGTLLQEMGLAQGEYPELWNISHREAVIGIHKAYFDAGCNVVTTNTFGANTLKFKEDELEEIIRAALDCAKEAREAARSGQEKFIALDIGPSGKLLKPLGDLDIEDAVALFSKSAALGEKYGADLIIIETMNDSLETKAALLAAKESTSLPVVVSNVYGEDGKLMTGADPAAMVALIEGLGADALGANCSLGPKQLMSTAKELISLASIPIIIQPNAGLPRVENGKTVFDVSPEEFALDLSELVSAGVRIVGGCCGTTPAHIEALVKRAASIPPLPVTYKEDTVISSYTHALRFGGRPVLIGERINPTGKKRFKQALAEKDMSYILGEGVKQEAAGAMALDVNVGLPEIDEAEMLVQTVCELQAVTDLPLQIDTADPTAMEAALRRYNGKALVNSVNGKKESMEAIFPLVKKYGGAVIALTLDEDGIPSTADGRVAIAKKILDTAAAYGINKKDIIFDTLAMTVSADSSAASVTLEALRRIREELGCHTSLGVSNVSFGLPCRDAINSTFFALALADGLSAAIMNPHSAEMMRTYYSFCALRGLDENCKSYIEKIPTLTPTTPTAPAAANGGSDSASQPTSQLVFAISKGFREQAAEITATLLESKAPLDIVQEEIIPALNEVGRGFEENKIYLPQLLMSAEAAKSAFEKIKERLAKDSSESKTGATFVIATVKGDIHDIGKNIVKLLLENYGFNVIDLGRDVPPETVTETVIKNRAPIVGLSALMTTTVPAMEETIKQLRKSAPWCKIVVGGAVLTQEYADMIGADKYAKDAMETVRYAQEITRL